MMGSLGASFGCWGDSLIDGEAVLGAGKAVWLIGRQFCGSGRKFDYWGGCFVARGGSFTDVVLGAGETV